MLKGKVGNFHMTPETPTRQFYTFVIASGFFYGCIPIKSKYNIITCLGRCWSLTPGYMYTAFRIPALLINWWTESSDWPSTQVGRDVNTSPVSVGRQVINTPFSSPAYVFIASEWTGEFSWLFWIQTSPRRIRYFDASSLITSSTEKQTHVRTESQNTLTKSLPLPKK